MRFFKKHSYFIILILLSLFSCKTDKKSDDTTKYIAEKKNDTITFQDIEEEYEKSIIRVEKDTSQAKKNNIPIGVDFTDCEKYWKLHFPSSSVRTKILDEILSMNELSENNQKFVTQLKTVTSSKLVIENPIFPIFRSSKSQIGVMAFPKNDVITAEEKLIGNINYDHITAEENEKVKFYPKILDSIYIGKQKPIIYYYTTKGNKTTKIKDLGILIADCTEYFEYSFDTKNISISDTILFGSPFQIDLIYENNLHVDSVIRNQTAPKHCFDCPSSSHLSKTFARLKGTKNVYFIFADTFPFNNELDTPSRELVFLTENDEIISLWSEVIDLFGCPCL